MEPFRRGVDTRFHALLGTPDRESGTAYTVTLIFCQDQLNDRRKQTQCN
jgi:hypothetical protein